MKFPLTTIKPIYASWITEFYNHVFTEEVIHIILNGWKASGILGSVQDGSAGLPPIDPFQDLCPLPSSPHVANSDLEMPGSEIIGDFINEQDENDSEDSDWEGDNSNFDRNAFDFIIDDELDS